MLSRTLYLFFFDLWACKLNQKWVCGADPSLEWRMNCRTGGRILAHATSHGAGTVAKIFPERRVSSRSNQDKLVLARWGILGDVGSGPQWHYFWVNVRRLLPLMSWDDFIFLIFCFPDFAFSVLSNLSFNYRGSELKKRIICFKASLWKRRNKGAGVENIP